MSNKKQFNPDQLMMIGRSLNEYLHMFKLKLDDFKEKKILDCPAGASSFIAELNKLGYKAVATDILYQLSSEQLEKKCRQDLDRAIKGLIFSAYLNDWDNIDIDSLKKNRTSAYQQFIEDYKIKRNISYIPCQLPSLPFKDGEFNLILSSNLLFLYDDILDYQFHVNAIKEMLRVCSDEIRIFPLSKLDNQQSFFLDKVLNQLKENDLKVDMLQSTSDFYLGDKEILIIKK